MFEEAKALKTSDGELFDNKIECVKHELELLFNSEWGDRSVQLHMLEVVSDIIIENKDKIKLLLEEIDE